MNRFAITPEKEYTDCKGSEPFNYPSGTYAFDVTSILKGSSFEGVVDKSKIKSATLWTIVPSGDKGKNELQFNNKNWKNVYKGEPYNDLAIDKSPDKTIASRWSE